MSGPSRTREELIQLEYVLHEMLIEERLETRRGDPVRVAAEFLGVDKDDVRQVPRKVTMTDIPAVQVVLAQNIAGTDPSMVSGATVNEAASWTTLDLGTRRIRVPEYVGVRHAAGEVADFPMLFRAWPKNNGFELHMEALVDRAHEAAADQFLEDLVAAARGERSPFRHRLVEASAGQAGVSLRLVDLEATSRSTLVLPDSVWEDVRRNVDRMFERMDRLAASGLGTNRGMILAGPPGTGKSALCRALAHDYVGQATVAIVSASAGQYVLGQLYEKLDGLAPSLVLIEDLDLLVGDRGDNERFPLIQFLTVLDGLMTHHSRVITIATTNDVDLVDAAAVRAARFDQVVELGLPDAPIRARILDVYLEQLEHDADVDELARATDGFSGADLREVVRSAVLDSSDDRISRHDLVAAIELRRRHLDHVSTGSYL